MNKKIVALFFLLAFLFLGIQQASAEDILGIGDSIALGYPGTTGPWPELGTLKSMTTTNAGVGGDSASGVDGRIQDELTAHSPSLVYVIVGSNDVRFLGTSLSAYLASLDSIKTKITNAGATMTMCLITPVSACCGGTYGRTETGQQNEKLWNAAIEEWCYDNSVACSANYQEMAYNDVSHEDDLYYDSTASDGVHVSFAGFTRMATLMYNAAVPIKKRTWGSTSFPTMCYNSWDWFILAGGAAITGDADTGTLNLPQNATADSSVECLPSGSKTIQITANVVSGSVILQYRSVATTNFNRNAATSWTTYTEPFSSTDQFFQVRITNTGDLATISDVTLDWTGDIPSTPDLFNGSISGGFQFQ